MFLPCIFSYVSIYISLYYLVSFWLLFGIYLVTFFLEYFWSLFINFLVFPLWIFSVLYFWLILYFKISFYLIKFVSCYLFGICVGYCLVCNCYDNNGMLWFLCYLLCSRLLVLEFPWFLLLKFLVIFVLIIWLMFFFFFPHFCHLRLFIYFLLFRTLLVTFWYLVVHHSCVPFISF